MSICVVGTGYVGLVTGAVFADLGNDVVCRNLYEPERMRRLGFEYHSIGRKPVVPV